MQRFFSLVIICAILVVGGGYLWMQKSEQEARERTEQKLSDARRTFADKARSAASEEESERYVRSIQAAIKSYDDELKKSVYKEKPEWRDPGEYEKRVTLQFKEGEIQEAQHKSMMEGYKLVRDAYDTLMAANWKPVLTAAGAGGTRLDIYDVTRIRDDDGNPILEGKFFFWGVEDNTRIQWGLLSLRYWDTAMEQVKEGRKMVEKEVEKVLGRAEGDSQPRIIIQTPNRYVAEFPSYVSIGRIWLPVMPREAKNVDIEYTYQAKKSGGMFDAALTWPKLSIPVRWQLKEGEAWDADVIEATEDEIAGKEGAEGADEVAE